MSSRYVIRGEVCNYMNQAIMGEDLRTLTEEDKLDIISAMFDDGVKGKLEAALAILNTQVEVSPHGEIVLFTDLRYAKGSDNVERISTNNATGENEKHEEEEESEEEYPASHEVEAIPPTLRSSSEDLKKLIANSVKQ